VGFGHSDRVTGLTVAGRLAKQARLISALNADVVSPLRCDPGTTPGSSRCHRGEVASLIRSVGTASDGGDELVMLPNITRPYADDGVIPALPILTSSDGQLCTLRVKSHVLFVFNGLSGCYCGSVVWYCSNHWLANTNNHDSQNPSTRPHCHAQRGTVAWPPR
jgi:hypothetical protein